MIILFASEVASACGYHPYRKIHETFIKVLNRITNDDSFRTADDDIKDMINDNASMSKLIDDASNADTIHDVETSVKKIELVIPKSLIQEVDEAIKLIDKVSTSETVAEAKTLLHSIDPVALNVPIPNIDKIETLDDVISVVDQMKSSIPVNTLISDDDRKNIAKSIESAMNCKFGTKQESIAISNYEKQLNVSVDQRNDKFHKRKVGDIAGHPIYVGGKVDGVKEDGTVVEVKNRLRRFFDPLPRYDIIQLQTYLFILNTTNGELVEHLKGGTTNIKTTEIQCDPIQWNDDVKPRILSFCKALIRVINDPELYESLRDGNDCENTVKELLKVEY